MQPTLDIRTGILAHQVVFAVLLFTAPAQAEQRAATPAVSEAMKRPRIAAAMAARERMDAAAIARDVTVIASLLASDAILNGPNNKVNDRTSILSNNAAGRVNHDTMTRSIEYAAERGSDVVFMGEETVTPRDAARDGKVVRRRFTDVWTETPQGWKLAMRQATIFSRN